MNEIKLFNFAFVLIFLTHDLLEVALPPAGLLRHARAHLLHGVGELGLGLRIQEDQLN